MDIRKTPPIACVYRANEVGSVLPEPRQYVRAEDFFALCRRLEAAERAAKRIAGAYVKLKDSVGAV